MTNDEYKDYVAKIRGEAKASMENHIRAGFESGQIKRGCKNAKMPKTVNKAMDRVPVAKPTVNLSQFLKHPLPCIHLGQRLKKCFMHPQLGHVYHCNLLDKKCGRSQYARGAEVFCEECPSYKSNQVWPIKYHEKNLWTSVPGKRFNASIIDNGDGYIIAFRNGWGGSDIYVGQLDRAFQPMGIAKRLELKHRRAKYGREDPRLFRFRGQLHIAYIGCVGHTAPLRTHQLYARLSDRLTVEQEFAPRLRVRQHWEKNWQFFEYDNELYVVYTISPHKVIHISGETTNPVHETNPQLPWSGGLLRGGASPVRVGDQFVSFFHGRVAEPDYPVYNTGVYTFEAKPPFRITSITPNPIDIADATDKPTDQWCPVLFCGGAVRVEDHWVTANGVHDRWMEIRRYPISDIEGKVCSVLPEDVLPDLSGNTVA